MFTSPVAVLPTYYRKRNRGSDSESGELNPVEPPVSGAVLPSIHTV